MTDRRSKKSDDYEAKLIAFVRKAQEDAAAIDRVRHVVTTGTIAAPDPTDWDVGYNQALRDVRDALDGESDE